jgi:hypothetical protein
VVNRFKQINILQASICQARSVEEKLDLLEKLHPVLFQGSSTRIGGALRYSYV